MNRMARTLPLLASLSLLACAGPTYYGVKYDYDLKNLLTADNQPPGPGARDLVKRAVTVAFYPPDYCRETSAARAAGDGNSESLRLRCGVQMSDLETEASRAGFQVVSWQTLRYGSPIELARANKVDILFEVNELTYDYTPEQIYALTDMRFFQRAKSRSDPAQPVVLQDVKTTGAQCRKGFRSGLQNTVAAVLDVKMVGVSDSRVHWAYSAAKVDEPSRDRSFTRTWTVSPLPDSGSGLTSWGPPVVGVGLGGVLIGGIFLIVGDAPTEMKSLAAILIPVGVLVALGGVGVWAVGAVIDTAFPKYPPPDGVICAQDSLEAAQNAAAQAAPVAGSSVQVADDGKQSDPALARKRALFRTIVRDFMAQVQYLKQ